MISNLLLNLIYYMGICMIVNKTSSLQGGLESVLLRRGNLFIQYIIFFMSNLQHRQAKIQAKRKTTPWREFVMEIASWFPLNIYKHGGFISRYPDTDRVI